MNLFVQIVCAFSAGSTIVLARSINGYLAKKIGAYQSSYFNYLTGLFTSLIIWLLMTFPTSVSIQTFLDIPNTVMFFGGVIGVINIVILNLVVSKIAPLHLTLIVFIAQLASGVVLDYFLYDSFSFKKLIGCCIVFLGLIHYQYVQRKQMLT